MSLISRVEVRQLWNGSRNIRQAFHKQFGIAVGTTVVLCLGRYFNGLIFFPLTCRWIGTLLLIVR
jgi:hypothetical protein